MKMFGGMIKYRIVEEKNNDNIRYVIEKKVNLIFHKKWSRNYLSGKEKHFHTTEKDSAKKIVDILNGKYDKQRVI